MTSHLNEGIAIIGMAGRFPGARDTREFWNNLRAGVESIRRFSDVELTERGVSAETLKHPNLVKAGTILDDADMFDAAFFGFSPREAEVMDPQHRVFLEAAWTALEDAGYNPQACAVPVGLYAGVSMNTYMFNLIANPELAAAVGLYQFMLSNDKDFLTTRVSYKLNLKGPSLTVQTACSTSLVAVQLACQALLNYQCDLALAGGVSLSVPQGRGYFYQEGMILSPDGHCRAFDARGQGIVSGQGVGIVVLKRYPDAVRDGDCIRAVIRGAAINNDGSLKVGYTAPSIDGQAEVIATALALAQVPPESVSYVEAHGTGTPLGDPIEIAALTHAFRASTQKKGFCAIGSVKTNIGHLDAAAGVAGLIKTVLALQHREIPASLHFEQPNAKIDFENSPFRVNARLVPWTADGGPRRAGVSSFGIGGTNAHAIVEEAPAPPSPGPGRPFQILVFSARTATALDHLTGNLLEALRVLPADQLPDFAYTLQAGRKFFEHRRMLVCRDPAEAVATIESRQRFFTGGEPAKKRSVVFLFPGQGSQYVSMGRGLYEQEPVFRSHIDECCEWLQPHLGLDLREVLYPTGPAEEAARMLNQTRLTQPALFVIEHALAKLWISWGIQPQAMAGHSIGEYVAACLAGVMTLPAALELVAARARLMQELPPGAMTAVALPAADVAAELAAARWAHQLSLAVVNAPAACVVAGPFEAIESWEKHCVERGWSCRRLHTSHAFHSGMMEPILDRFEACLRGIDLKPPTLPYLSNLTGTWMKAADAVDPTYWVRHLRQTVRFSDNVRELLLQPDRVFLEVGPGQVLTTLARQQVSPGSAAHLFGSMRHPQDPQPDSGFTLAILGQLWLAGVEVDWAGFTRLEQRRRIPVPTYPFERHRFWVEPRKAGPRPPGRDPEARKPVEEWLYFPTWRRTRPLETRVTSAPAPVLPPTTWLILEDACGLASRLAERLGQLGQSVSRVRLAAGPGEIQDDIETLRIDSAPDYDAFIRRLIAQGKMPDRILHCGSVTSRTEGAGDAERFETAQGPGFYSLLFLIQALARNKVSQDIRLDVVANHLFQVTDDEWIDPAKSTLLGPCKVIPQEYPNIRCRCIEVAEADGWDTVARTLLIEILSASADPVVAHRGGHRWVPDFELIACGEVPAPHPRLREAGVYLITGGLGRMGLVLADLLTDRFKARVILIARSGLPAPDARAAWLAAHPEGDPTSRRIRKIEAIEARGGQLLMLDADCADPAAFGAALEQAERRFGPVNGVIHAAGDLSGAEIGSLDRAGCERQFRPKVAGLLTLQQAFRDRPLDFFVLASSVASTLGGLGFTAYAAANLYLDAMACRQNRGRGTPWFCMNWDAWNFTENKEEDRSALAALAIRPKEGAEVFLRVLALEGAPQAVISTSSLQARIDTWVRRRQAGRVVDEEKAAAAPLHARPNLSSAYVAPGTAAEQTIADIWQQLLGVDRVGVHDNFFELGGHSLLATQVVALLRKAFPTEFSVATLFERPTVHSLGQLVSASADSAPSFADSSDRGKRRKERKLQRMNVDKKEIVS